MKLKVYAYKSNSDNIDIVNDWKLYELILFNVISNAVKFNVQEGDIIITVKVVPEEPGSKKFILQTKVIDSGIGISEYRQKNLFIPFLELKTVQGIASTD